jgi:hypothetical protein
VALRRRLSPGVPLSWVYFDRATLRCGTEVVNTILVQFIAVRRSKRLNVSFCAESTSICIGVVRRSAGRQSF